MRSEIDKRFRGDRLSEVVAYGCHQLSDPLYVVILRADETQSALPWVLAETAHSKKGGCDWSEVLRVSFAPLSV